MRIIGIHDGHNAAACYVKDGEVINIIQEERLVNEKNFSGFPACVIAKILELNRLGYDQIDCFAFNGYHVAYPENKDGLMKAYRDSYSKKSKLKQFAKRTPLYSLYKGKTRRKRIEPLISQGVDRDKIAFVEHHLAHACSAYFGAPWIDHDDQVLVLTQDGAGDQLSGTVSIAQDGKIQRIAAIGKDDSLGRVYSTVTFMLGMVPLEHEYKLMGMAPYASPEAAEASFSVFKNLLSFVDRDGLVWKRRSGLPPMQQIYPYLRKELEFHRFDWIAAGLQKFTEELLVSWAQNAINKSGINKLVLSGGTFMNVKANQRISELDDVERIFIFPSCGDESNALGAAWHVFYSNNPGAPRNPIRHLYLGDDPTDDETCIKAINKFEKSVSEKVYFEKHANIEVIVAQLLAKGEIVARCKGPMEFGARALGNRSILCEASDLSKITIINNMIKKRDFWMPFAPVILSERSNDYIVNQKEIDAPFMIITFNTTRNYKDFIGGVQQVDLTARPQLIEESVNIEYYKLLKHYESITGKGVLINTSFNLHGLPIVHGPEEALFVFKNSGLRYLALGNYLLKKDR